MVGTPSANGDRELHLRQMQLNSLLEMTKAINANLPETSLYKIYHFTLLAGLEIKKMALFVNEANWICKVNFGVNSSLFTASLPDSLKEIQNVEKVKLEGDFCDLTLAIPVKHKDKSLAVLLLGVNEGESKLDTSFIQTFTNITLVAIENKRLARLGLEQEALKKEIEIAQRVQQNLIPDILPHTDALELYASYYPHKIVGGDYYDFIPVDEHRFYICIADVSGKGIPAALLMSNFQACLRTLVLYTSDLKEIITRLNEQVYAHTKGEKFITAFLAYVDLSQKTFQCINAGHNPPVLFTNGSHSWLDKGTCILGMISKLPFLEETVLPITSEMCLFAYTDGLSEVMNDKGEEFGPEGVLEMISNFGSFSNDVHLKIYDHVSAYKGKQDFPDDITYLSCVIKV